VYEELLTVEDAATALRVSTKTVLRLIHSRQLPAHKVGRAWRVRSGDLRRCFIECHADDVVYLDDNASNPIDRRVVDAMVETLSSTVGNASSVHEVGLRSRARIEDAREKLAALLSARPTDVVFTSGATEANNLLLHGWPRRGNRSRVVVSAGEHDSVLRVAERLAADGHAKVTVVPLLPTGAVDLAALSNAMADDVALVSVIAANSETGVLNPIRAMSEMVHDAGAELHCDATQWVGRLPWSMGALGVDAISISSHKMRGPQGVGAIVATKRILRSLTPVQVGGGHENGVRSGSYNVAGIVGFGVAAELAADAGDETTLQEMRDRLVEQLRAAGDVHVNGAGQPRLPNTANVRIVGCPGDVLLARTPSVAASLGSACHAGAPEPSRVLLAMGLDRSAASESIRFSVCHSTTRLDVDRAAEALCRSIAEIRSLNEAVA
jgi:cysteine desulfurase